MCPSHVPRGYNDFRFNLSAITSLRKFGALPRYQQFLFCTKFVSIYVPKSWLEKRYGFSNRGGAEPRLIESFDPRVRGGCGTVHRVTCQMSLLRPHLITSWEFLVRVQHRQSAGVRVGGVEGQVYIRRSQVKCRQPPPLRSKALYN